MKGALVGKCLDESEIIGHQRVIHVFFRSCLCVCLCIYRKLVYTCIYVARR